MRVVDAGFPLNIRPGRSVSARGVIVVHIPQSTSVPVSAGHPWVYREQGVSPPLGELVRLVDPRGRDVGWGIGDAGPIAVRVLGAGATVPLPAFLKARIAGADRVRASMLGDVTNAYRVVNGEGDGLGGLVVDRYDDVAVLRLYAKAWEVHLDLVIDAVRALPWAKHGLRRLGVGTVDGKEGSVDLWGSPSHDIVVVEYGLKFRVRPQVGQKTGMFLDLREQRVRARRAGAGAVVTNLFAYAGALSVAAVAGGAKRVVSVDIAPAALEDARETFRLNDLSTDGHGFEVADAFQWDSPSPLDLLIVDPPSLARKSASMGAAVSAYRKLHARNRESVRPGGWLLASSCTSRVSTEAWRGALRDALGRDWTWSETGAEPVDHPVLVGHPEGRYLKTALLRRLA